MVLRPVAAVGTAVAVLTIPLMVAHARSLPVGSRSLGAGTAVVPRCAPSGFTVTKTIDVLNNTVTGVAISQIPAACGGAPIGVTVNNGSAYSSGSGTVPAGGGSMALVLAAPLTLTPSEQVDVVVAGP